MGGGRGRPQGRTGGTCSLWLVHCPGLCCSRELVNCDDPMMVEAIVMMLVVRVWSVGDTVSGVMVGLRPD